VILRRAREGGRCPQAPERNEATAKLLRAPAILGFSPLQRAAAAERKPAYWYSALI